MGDNRGGEEQEQDEGLRRWRREDEKGEAEELRDGREW